MKKIFIASDHAGFDLKKQILNSVKAKIIDLGGESARPGAKEIDAQKEWKRIRRSLYERKYCDDGLLQRQKGYTRFF